jgi:hypothetical protein
VSVLFPKWLNLLPTAVALGGAGAGLVVPVGVWYYATPDFFEVGYMPNQPGSGFNHQIHAGKLGMDCRYCHTHVEESPEANVPSVATCIGCHADTRLSNLVVADEKVAFIRTAYASDESVSWRRVHKLPDYVRNFPHHVHVKAGVSCYSCHGQITGMPVVSQDQGLGMGWCLKCHRNPEPNMVPPDKVTDLRWVENTWMQTPVKQRDYHGVTPEGLVKALREKPPQNCGYCHH